MHGGICTKHKEDRVNTPEQTRRMVENLTRAIEVTELALDLRCAKLPEADVMKQVMREVCAANSGLVSALLQIVRHLNQERLQSALADSWAYSALGGPRPPTSPS